MKTLHLSILAGLGIAVIGMVLVFFQPHIPTFEEQGRDIEDQQVIQRNSGQNQFRLWYYHDNY